MAFVCIFNDTNVKVWLTLKCQTNMSDSVFRIYTCHQ